MEGNCQFHLTSVSGDSVVWLDPILLGSRCLAFGMFPGTKEVWKGVENEAGRVGVA